MNARDSLNKNRADWAGRVPAHRGYPYQRNPQVGGVVNAPSYDPVEPRPVEPERAGEGESGAHEGEDSRAEDAQKR